MHAVNYTVTRLPLHITVSPLSIGAWQLMHVLDGAVAQQQQWGATDNDTDDVVRMFAETPVWLLCLTLVVSMVHLLFDLLALRSDVAFWATATSLKGISAASLAAQVRCPLPPLAVPLLHSPLRVATPPPPAVRVAVHHWRLPVRRVR